MGKPLSVDLRDRVVAAVADGMSRRQAAARFGVSISSAIRWTSLSRRTGAARAKRQGGGRAAARPARLPRRRAAARVGVSISSAIRWTSLSRRTGDVRPKRQGGDKRSARIEAHAPVILGAVAQKPDITLVELQTLLAEHRVTVAVSTLWRFFARRQLTLNKSP